MCPLIRCGMCDKLIPPSVLKIEPKAEFCSEDCTADYTSMTEWIDNELMDFYDGTQK